jgi:hypothetical protein
MSPRRSGAAVRAARATLATWAAVAILATGGGASGCFTVRAELPGALRADVTPEHLDKVGELQVQTTVFYFLGGLVGEAPRDLVARELRRQVQARAGDGVAQLTWRSEFTCTDVAIGGCTLGLVTPRTYRVSGDIVRIRQAPLPGRSLPWVAEDAATRTPAADDQPTASVAQAF